MPPSGVLASVPAGPPLRAPVPPSVVLGAAPLRAPRVARGFDGGVVWNGSGERVSEPLKKPSRARSGVALLGGAALAVIGATAAAVRFWASHSDQGSVSELPDASASVAPSVVAMVSATTSDAAMAPPSSSCPPEMAFLASGTFRMGSEATDKDADADERPAHDVTLSALDVAEVTVAKFRRCTKEARNGLTCPAAATTVQWEGKRNKGNYGFGPRREKLDLAAWFVVSGSLRSRPHAVHACQAPSLHAGRGLLLPGPLGSRPSCRPWQETPSRRRPLLARPRRRT